MDELVAVGMAARGFLTTTELLRHVERTGLDRIVRRGELVRVRAGVYVDGARFRSGEPVARHVTAARAVAGLLGDGYAVSHLSAVALHRLPVLRSDLGRVHLSRLRPGKPRADERLQVHTTVPAAAVVDVGGTPVVRAAVGVVQAAASSGVRAGIVAADAAMRSGVTYDELAWALDVGRLGRGHRVAARVVARRMAGPSRPGSRGRVSSWRR
jgi:hypothetical protein